MLQKRGSKHIYVLNPHERVVELRIDGLQIFDSQRFVENALVKRQRETRVDELPMKESLMDENSV